MRGAGSIAREFQTSGVGGRLFTITPWRTAMAWATESVGIHGEDVAVN